LFNKNNPIPVIVSTDKKEMWQKRAQKHNILVVMKESALNTHS